MDTLVIALFLSVVTNRVLEAFVAPLKVKFPNVDMWWLIYVSWVLAGGLAWAAGINLFVAYLPGQELVGRVLTAIVVGGGSNLLADLFPPTPALKSAKR